MVKKGIKVCNATRKRMVGVACSNLEELKTKGCQKLQIKSDIKKIDVCLSDGTIVDDELYFRSLPNQTVVLLRQPGEKIVEVRSPHRSIWAEHFNKNKLLEEIDNV